MDMKRALALLLLVGTMALVVTPAFAGKKKKVTPVQVAPMETTEEMLLTRNPLDFFVTFSMVSGRSVLVELRLINESYFVPLTGEASAKTTMLPSWDVEQKPTGPVVYGFSGSDRGYVTYTASCNLDYKDCAEILPNKHYPGNLRADYLVPGLPAISLLDACVEYVAPTKTVVGPTGGTFDNSCRKHHEITLQIETKILH
jgi:hypothetical protein